MGKTFEQQLKQKRNRGFRWFRIVSWVGVASVIIVPPIVAMSIIFTNDKEEPLTDQHRLNNYLDSVSLAGHVEGKKTIEHLDTHEAQTEEWVTITSQEEADAIKEEIGLEHFNIGTIQEGYVLKGKLTSNTDQEHNTPKHYTYTITVSAEGLESKSKTTTVKSLDNHTLPTTPDTSVEQEIARIETSYAGIIIPATGITNDNEKASRLKTEMNLVDGVFTYTVLVTGSSFVVTVQKDDRSLTSSSINFESSDEVYYGPQVDAEVARIQSVHTTNSVLPLGTILRNGTVSGIALTNIETHFAFDKSNFNYVVVARIDSDLSFNIIITVTHKVATSVTRDVPSLLVTVAENSEHTTLVNNEITRIETAYPKVDVPYNADYATNQARLVSAIKAQMSLTNGTFEYELFLLEGSKFKLAIWKDHTVKYTKDILYVIGINYALTQELITERFRIQDIRKDFPSGTVWEVGSNVEGSTEPSLSPSFVTLIEEHYIFNKTKFSYSITTFDNGTQKSIRVDIVHNSDSRVKDNFIISVITFAP